MSVQAKREARLLTAEEQAEVEASRHPAVIQLSRPELLALIRRLREHRDRAQGIARQQRREIRGKGDPRGASPARDNVGSIAKAQVLAQALKRANAELSRRDTPEEVAPTQSDIARKALALKQAARVARHPNAGRTASLGMTAKPSHRDTVQMDPREIGRVSQATKVAQARRDA